MKNPQPNPKDFVLKTFCFYRSKNSSDVAFTCQIFMSNICSFIEKILNNINGRTFNCSTQRRCQSQRFMMNFCTSIDQRSNDVNLTRICCVMQRRPFKLIFQMNVCPNDRTIERSTEKNTFLRVKNPKFLPALKKKFDRFEISGRGSDHQWRLKEFITNVDGHTRLKSVEHCVKISSMC